MSEASSSSSGFGTLLTVLFIGLKLTGYIDWSWFWVLSPLWISFGIFLIILVVFVIAAVAFDGKVTMRRRR